MNTEEIQEFDTKILSDDEFARLMMVEFTATVRKKTTIARHVTKFQMALWAAGLGVFVVHPSERLPDIDTEFMISPYLETPTPDQSVVRAKNEGSSKPYLYVEFTQVEKRLSAPDDDSQASSTDVVHVTLTASGIRSVRADVHVNGKLLTARAFDTLKDPLEQKQDALFKERKWGYALSKKDSTLICIKPSMAPASPHRLTRDEMKQRADTFQGRCYFHEPEAQ